MKKLVLAALAIGAMAACTKSNVQYEQPGEISLQPVTQKATKAFYGAIGETAYPKEENFKVWAWWGNADPTSNVTYSDFETPYIAAAEFHFNETHQTWAGWDGVKHNPYYWPTTGSLVFAGYSPASANGSFSFPSGSTGTFSAEGFKQDTDISKTVDLMWFNSDGTSYNMNPTSSESAKGVPAKFQHALSWLTFKFNLKDASTPKNWVVTNVKLTGIATKGNFTTSPKLNWVLSNEEAYLNEEMTVFTGEKEISHSDNPVALENSPNGVVVIPQPCASAEAQLVVTYKLKKQGVGGYLNEQNVSLNLNVGDPNIWQPGKHYVYTITFGANEILISPTVATWEEKEITIE